jgi:hypothetical protein
VIGKRLQLREFQEAIMRELIQNEIKAVSGGKHHGHHHGRHHGHGRKSTTTTTTSTDTTATDTSGSVVIAVLPPLVV